MAFGKKMSLVGLDVGSRTLKVAKVEDSKLGFKLKKFGTQDIPPGLIEDGVIKDHEALADAIRQLFKLYKIKDKNVALSIGGFSIIVKTITVQSMPESELQETIKFEAEQYIPFDISDVNLDFQILGEDTDNPNQMNVLLVAAKKEIVEDYSRLVSMAGLNPLIIDVDAFALQNVFEVNYEEEHESVALIDIGSSKTTINIVKENQTVLIRDVNQGCWQITRQIVSQVGCSLEEAEQLFHVGEGEIESPEAREIVTNIANEWCVEIRRVLDYFYSTYPGDHIKYVLLSGGGANVKHFRKALGDETSTEIKTIYPFERIIVGTFFEPSYLERIAPQSSICLGLAIRRVGDK